MPSLLLSSIILAATSRPTAAPASFAAPSATLASVVVRAASSIFFWSGTSCVSTACAAAIAAASAEAPAGGDTSTAYGVYLRSMLFTASNIAAWAMATMRDCHPVLMPTVAAARMAVSFQSVTASAWARVAKSGHRTHTTSALRPRRTRVTCGVVYSRIGIVQPPFDSDSRYRLSRESKDFHSRSPIGLGTRASPAGDDDRRQLHWQATPVMRHTVA